MSEHKESLVKVLEYIVNDEQEKAADLLHNVFVEKAKNHWSSLQENDEIVEDEIADEDLDETIDLDEADDDSEDDEVEEAIDAFTVTTALLNVGETRWTIIQLNTRLQTREHRVVHAPHDTDKILPLHSCRRMHQCIGQFAIGGHKKQPRRIVIKATHRYPAT